MSRADGVVPSHAGNASIARTALIRVRKSVVLLDANEASASINCISFHDVSVKGINVVADTRQHSSIALLITGSAAPVTGSLSLMPATPNSGWRLSRAG